MYLKLKHLAPYLPFLLKGIDIKDPELIQLVQGLMPFSIITESDELPYGMFKPILRSIKDVETFKYKPRYGKEITISQILTIENMDSLISGNLDEIPYAIIDILFKYQFDVFGLIDAKLAVDIN